MATYITEEEIETLIEIENYLGEKESWSESTTKIWNVVENLVKRRHKTNEQAKNNMRKYRKENKNYGRA